MYVYLITITSTSHGTAIL